PEASRPGEQGEKVRGAEGFYRCPLPPQEPQGWRVCEPLPVMTHWPSPVPLQVVQRIGALISGRVSIT
uniref:hypothetical protein n=1 Tax=Streptomyces antimycoticus TaxID=68175 RepID=UPI001F2975B7